jgi:hypothetical protein
VAVFLVDRLAVFFLATELFVAFFLADGLAFLAGFFFAVAFFFVDRLAVFLLAGFFFVTVFFLGRPLGLCRRPFRGRLLFRCHL